MAVQERRLYTHAEYFALEEQANYKSEYYQGKIIALAGGSLNHNRIARNTCFAIDEALGERPCEAFIGDVRLWIAKKDFYTYPDVMVVCGEAEFVEGRSDTITNPQVIIEVLSESTVGYDRGDKFQAYWTLETFKEYVLIDQYRLQVEHFRRMDEKLWQLQILTTQEEQLTLRSIKVTIPLNQIYRNVTWDE